MTDYAAALVFVTPLALLLGQPAHPGDVPGLLADRALETAIGLATGLSAAVLTREEGPAGVGAAATSALQR